MHTEFPALSRDKGVPSPGLLRLTTPLIDKDSQSLHSLPSPLCRQLGLLKLLVEWFQSRPPYIKCITPAVSLCRFAYSHDEAVCCGWRWDTWTENDEETLVQSRPSSGEKGSELDLGQGEGWEEKTVWGSPWRARDGLSSMPPLNVGCQACKHPKCKPGLPACKDIS